MYFAGDWYIIDGDMIKGLNDEPIFRESANGTWISLVDYRMKSDRQESEPKLLEDDTEIKISDTILKVTKKFICWFIVNHFNSSNTPKNIQALSKTNQWEI